MGSFSINYLGNCLSLNDIVCHLGVLLDSKLRFTNQVNSVIKSCVNLLDLHHIRLLLSFDVSIMVANALVGSRLDYSKFQFHSLSSKNIIKPQNIQNCLADFY